MIEGLPEVYGQAAIAPISEETLEKRSKAILAITTKRKMNWLLDCVRLYLKKPIGNEAFRGDFVKMFKDEDPMFYEADNDLELRLLAGAIINEYIGKKKNEDRCILAMALLCGYFGMDKGAVINSAIIKRAMDEIEIQANNLRTGHEIASPTIPELDEISTDFTEVQSINKYLRKLNETLLEFLAEYENAEHSLRHKVNVLSEESQIHWWLFRSYSTTSEERFDELDVKVAPVILAYELYVITDMFPGPVNTEEFLRKAFSFVPGLENSQYTVTDAINALYENLSDIIKEIDIERFGNLCPLILGVHKAIDSAGDIGWTKVFENFTGLSAQFTAPPINIAIQLYNEALLCYTKQ